MASRQIATFNALVRALARANDAPTLLDLESKLTAAEQLMRDSALYSDAERRPVNEARMTARWKLGRLLAKMERGHKSKVNPLNFGKYLAKIGLTKPTAMLAQRIGAMPESEKEKAFTAAHRQDDFCTYEDLLRHARPWWYQAARKQKHRRIMQGVMGRPVDDRRFALIYADPPWRFAAYNADRSDRVPDQQYPTMSDAQIMAYDVRAQADAALLLWCTSSNIHRALAVVTAWGFEYKSQAVWVKLGADGGPISGLGLVFRNMHEVLLYATRGKMPGPQYQPPSVFLYPRARHSAKPPEIRQEIERMYPDFNEQARVEHFARGQVPGWTCFGYEANVADAA